MAKKNTTRVQLELPKSSMEQLRKLKNNLEASSYAEVLRTSIRILSNLEKENQKGNDILLRGKDGKEVILRFF